MASAIFVCPRCRTPLRLPPQLALAREVGEEGGSFIAFGERDSLPCGRCGYSIPIDDILNSPVHKHSFGARVAKGLGETIGCLIFLALGLLVVFALAKCN